MGSECQQQVEASRHYPVVSHRGGIDPSQDRPLLALRRLAMSDEPGGAPRVKIRLTIHENKDRFVVNTPGTHAQRQPRTYATLERARERIEELLREHPNAELE